MEDSAIIDLYWAREERALSETDTKYGGYCRSIAHNILRNREDTEECVSDTWLHAWNAMPPQRPSILSSFLGRITRNLSFDRCRRQNAEKRGGGALPLALDELSECVPAPGRVEHALEERELAEAIDRFLRTLPERECSMSTPCSRSPRGTRSRKTRQNRSSSARGRSCAGIWPGRVSSYERTDGKDLPRHRRCRRRSR